MRRRLTIGIVCLLLGIGGAITAVVFLFIAMFATDADIPVDGEPHSVSVEEGSERLVYVSRDSNTRCTVADSATGDQIELDRVGADVSRSVNGVERVAPWKFTPTGDRVEITCTGDTDVDVQIAPPFFTLQGMGLFVLAMIVCAALGIFGLVMIILTFARKSRNGPPVRSPQAGPWSGPPMGGPPPGGPPTMGGPPPGGPPPGAPPGGPPPSG